MSTKQVLIQGLTKIAAECVNDRGEFASTTFETQATTLLDTYHVELDISKILVAEKGNETITNFATRLGCSASYVTDVMNNKQSPGPKIYRALGVEKPKRWR